MTKKNNVVTMPTLADHLEDCEERYNAVINRIESVDARLDRMDTGLQEILKLLKSSRYKTQ